MMYKTKEEAWAMWTPEMAKAYKAKCYQLADGTFGVYGTNSKAPEGAHVVQTRRPRAKNKDPHAGTVDAHAALLAKHPQQVARACIAAVQVAMEKRTVTSQQARDRMIANGWLDKDDSSPQFWLGAAMRKLAVEGILRKTGRSASYSNPTRNVHERTHHEWELVPGAKTAPYETTP